jgi:AraC family transcriptional regulator
MTYRFKFERGLEPSLEFGLRGAWGGLSAATVSATPGRHVVEGSTDHMLVFYTSEPVQTECSSDAARQRRLQVPGDFDLLPAGCDGAWEDEGPSEMIALRMAPALVASAASSLGLPRDRATFAPRLGARDPLVEHVVRAILAEMQAPVPAGRLYVDALAVALTTRLLQGFARVMPGGGLQTLSKPQLRRIVEFVDANLEGDLSLPRIASVAGLSVAHLTALFRRTTGQSVHHYVMDQRVNRARRLLIDGRASIADVALQTGFSHQSHLSSWMRRRIGVTPSQLKREAKPEPRAGKVPVGAPAR